MYRFIKGDAVRITLTGGDWISIKRQLTAGEQIRVAARQAKPVRIGHPIEIDLEKAKVAPIAEYLLDWSFTDQDGRPVVIKDMPSEYIADVLNSLDGESLDEIQAAITAHEQTVADEKKTRNTATVS